MPRFSSFDDIFIYFKPPTSKVSVFRGFNGHNKDWMRSTKIDLQRRATKLFTVSNNFVKIINEPTFFTCVSENRYSHHALIAVLGFVAVQISES